MEYSQHPSNWVSMRDSCNARNLLLVMYSRSKADEVPPTSPPMSPPMSAPKIGTGMSAYPMSAPPMPDPILAVVPIINLFI